MNLDHLSPRTWGLLTLAILPASGTVLVLLVLLATHLVVRWLA
jgi:hypothetical protein